MPSQRADNKLRTPASMNVVAVIPARGGSERLPRKNVAEVFRKPMILWAIEACQRAASIDAVFVSSEDEEILAIAQAAGAGVIPRPSELARSQVPKVEAIRHADQWLYEKEHCHPHSLFSVQANSPELRTRDLEAAVRKLQEHRLWEVTSVNEQLIQNGAFRLIRQHSLYNTFLSAYLGVVPTDYLDIHTAEDLELLAQRYPTSEVFQARIQEDCAWAETQQESLTGELATSLDDFAISRELFCWIVENIPSGSKIIEFGSGSGTVELTKHFEVCSIEHDSKWLGHARQANYIHAPLVSYGNYQWYDHNVVKSNLSTDYDLIIVDGPPNNPQTSLIGRQGFVDHLHLFRCDVPIIFDDVNRPQEYDNMVAVADRLNQPFRVFRGWQKDFGIVGMPRGSRTP